MVINDLGYGIHSLYHGIYEYRISKLSLTCSVQNEPYNPVVISYPYTKISNYIGTEHYLPLLYLLCKLGF